MRLGSELVLKWAAICELYLCFAALMPAFRLCLAALSSSLLPDLKVMNLVTDVAYSFMSTRESVVAADLNISQSVH